ncbi:MAG: LysE family transporter [Oscillospiraceae bacterium]|nr:LysE family transporter [Oscillospiraceae bacterium]
MKAWYPLIVYLCVQCITPGPNNFTCLYLGAKYGVKGAVPYLIGSKTALFVKAILCGAFNIVLANSLPSAAKWLTWIGAGYMIYLAVIMMISGWKKTGSTDKFSGGTVRDGISLQIFNGKSWIVALSMFAVYVMPISKSFAAVLFASLLFVAIALISSLIWIFSAYSLHGLIEKYKKPFGIIMGLTLIWCAVKAVL